MTSYHYMFDADVSMSDVHDSLMLAILAMECMHGPAQTRLDLSQEFDPKKRTCVIEAGTDVGLDLSRLFTGFLQREFGQDSFSVERVPA